MSVEEWTRYENDSHEKSFRFPKSPMSASFKNDKKFDGQMYIHTAPWRTGETGNEGLHTWRELLLVIVVKWRWNYLKMSVHIIAFEGN